jgi:uncharacterized membrane protein
VNLPRGVGILGGIAIVSVAINLFLAGDLVGRHFRGPPSPANFQQRLEVLLRDLPAADKAIAHTVMESHYSDIIEKWRAFRPANQRAALAMHADPFDPAEARAAYDNVNKRSEDLREAVQNTMIEIAQKISPKGREHLRIPGGGL